MVLDLGLIGFEEAYRVQREMVSRRRLGEIEDSLIFAEHNSVFTVGRSGRMDGLLVNESYLRQKGIKILGVDRGGSITYHGPGQLVIYPIIKLTDGWRDLHKYLRSLEDVVINLLKRYGVASVREPGKTGVWISGKKIASVGVGVSSWITYHVVSINIDPDMEFFNMIYPCGIRGAKMVCLKDICARDIPMSEVKDRVLSDFDQVFKSGGTFFSFGISHERNPEQNDKMRGN